MKKTTDSAILLAVTTAVLYSWSTARYHGFLSTVGLDADTMERNFHQVIYSGMVVSFDEILLVLLSLTAFLFVWARAIVPGYVDYVRKSIKNKRKIIKIKKRIIGNRKAPLFETSSIKKSNNVAIYCVISFMFIFSLVYFERQGRDAANSALKAHFSDEKSGIQEIIVKINKSEKTLSFLACGGRNCAAIESETNKIFYFPQSLGYELTYKEKNITN